jgi:hypothetical protein
VEGDFIPQQALEKIEQINAADLVVGILANLDQESVATVHEAANTSWRFANRDSVGRCQFGPAHAVSASSGKGPRLTFVSWPPIGADTSGTPMRSISPAYLSLFAAARRLGAKAGCIIASKLEAVPPQWVCHLM